MSEGGGSHQVRFGVPERVLRAWVRQQYIEGLKLLFYELMDAAKGLILPEVLRHYAETAGQVVRELVRKVQKVRALRPGLGL